MVRAVAGGAPRKELQTAASGRRGAARLARALDRASPATSGVVVAAGCAAPATRPRRATDGVSAGLLRASHATTIVRRVRMDASGCPAALGLSSGPARVSAQALALWRIAAGGRGVEVDGVRPDGDRTRSCVRYGPRGRDGSSTAARTGYFLACSKYGLVPEAWSVTSTTRSISETVWVIATSMPWLRVTVAMPQP
jgi:hypothetical protein